MKKYNKVVIMVSLFTSLSFWQFAPKANNENQTFRSLQTQVPLIELYTSEGCSSCPPADRWLSSLNDSDGLWEQYVPVAFHVDYWNQLGWDDPFSSKEYSQRQRRYAAEFGETTVYTPGVRKAGFEWRKWRSSPTPLEHTETFSGENVGILSLTINDDDTFLANFDQDHLGSSKNYQLTIALLGMDLTTEVERGENHGKTLNHDFVVLATSTLASTEQNQWVGSLPETNLTAPQYAVAAWISKNGSQIPIQAVGGNLIQ